MKLADNLSEKTFNRRSKGLTLVELLIVLLLGILITGTVVGLLFTFVKSYEENVEYTTARQRGQMVFTILSRPVKLAGLGMPTSDDFGDCFSEEDEISSWEGPVDITGSDDILRIAYAVPSGIAVAEGKVYSSGSSLTIDLTSGDVAETDWITFPSANTVFKLNSTGSSEIDATPKSGNGGTLPFFDELHYVRFLQSTLEDGIFKVIDPLTGNSLSSVEGIEDVFFEYKSEEKLLTAYILARGDVRHDEMVTPEIVPGWPKDKEDVEPLSDETRHYRVSVHTGSWRVRN